MALTQQVILITGCSSGIGRALALELARRGQRVFASARNPETLRDLVEQGCEPLALDVTDAASIERALAQLLERAQRIDVLINNAGFNAVGPLAEVPLAQVRRLFDTNFTGPLALIQAVVPHMAARRSGRIVNIGSIMALLPTPFSGPYCASKAAVHMLSEVLRMEVAPFGIDVLEVQPGGVRSSIADTASGDLERYRAPSSLYRAVYAGIVRRAHTSQEKPMPAEAFARKVADAVLAARPPRLLRTGSGVHLYSAVSRLPHVARELLLTRRFGLLGWNGEPRTPAER
jgi:NAD(P)-dependent dehydrogenase (short-subunit alcohol dehydrogenase family)